jgi:hypothetical protein
MFDIRPAINTGRFRGVEFSATELPGRRFIAVLK